MQIEDIIKAMDGNLYILENKKSERRFYNSVGVYSDESFKDLINQTSEDIEIKEGNTVDGVISNIDRNFVFVSVGMKSEGRIPMQQFADSSALKVGNILPVYIENMETKDGGILLSYQKALKQQIWKALYDSYDSGEIKEVEGKILYTIKSGCIVDVDGLNAFLPSSHVDSKYLQNLNGLIGIKLRFHILKMDEKTGKIFVSRKKILNTIHEKARNEYISKSLQVGTIVTCKITSIANYGIFCALHSSEETGQIVGLCYIDDLAWGRVLHPSSIYSIGQEVTVKVIGLDLEKNKISLGIKQLAENPWKNITKKYTVGKIYPGVISAVENRGLYVTLESNVHGFVANSEISWVRERELFLPNQKINAMMLSINEEENKIALSIKQCKPNPWQEFLDYNNLGSIVSCKIVEIIDSGLIIHVQNDNFNYVKSIIKLHNISWNEDQQTKKMRSFVIGDEIKPKLIHVNPKIGKTIFSLKHTELDPFEAFLNKIKENDIITAKISRIEDDGIYVQVKDKLEFFSTQSNVSELSIGQELDFKVILKEKYKLKLIPCKNDEAR